MVNSKTSRLPRRSTVTSDASYVRHGLLLILGIGVLVGLLHQSLDGKFASTIHVTAAMDDVGGGVVPGSDVKMRGVVVGRVSTVGGDTSRISLDLELFDWAISDIPADVQARVLPASVFGTSYVDLLRPKGSDADAPIEAGATIGQDTSGPTLELQRALDNVDKLVKALGPAELSVVLHGLAGSLDGRGKDLATTTAKLNHLLSVVNPQIPLLQDDLRLVVTNLDTLRAAAPSLLNSLVDSTDIARNIVKHRDAYARLFVAAVGLVDDGDGFLDRTEQAFVRAIIASADVSDAVYDNRTQLPRQTIALDRLLTDVLTVTDGGPVRIDIRLVSAAALDYYTPADCPRYQGRPGTNCGR